MRKRLQAAAAWLWHHKRAGASMIDALLDCGDEEQASGILAKIRQKNQEELAFDQIVLEGSGIIEAYLEKGIRLIFAHSEAYPYKLYEAHTAIPILSVLGNVDLLHRRQIAVVGSRHPTES